MSLKSALNDLNNAVKDLTSLHVQTFTGVLDLKVEDGDNFNSLRKKLDTAKTKGDILLVAESLIKFDGDSYNFITNQADDVPNNAFDVHYKSVKSAQETRQAMLSLFKGLIKL